MWRYVAVAFAFLCLSCGGAAAQQAIVVATCNSVTLDAGFPHPIYMDVHGNQCVAPTGSGATVSLQATTTGGCTPYHLPGGSGASNNATAIKASAGATLCSMQVENTTATIYYLRLYDTASSPTCSSATGAVGSWPIPASTLTGGISLNLGPYGLAFANGIGFCITGGGADTDNTNAATGVWLNASYK